MKASNATSARNARNATNATNAINVTVIGGSGYVGFITGLGFAELGNQVINVDIDSDKVELMNNGQSPIYEEGIDLDEALHRNLREGRIEFTTDLFHPTRIIIGAESDRAKQLMRKLYAPFLQTGNDPAPIKRKERNNAISAKERDKRYERNEPNKPDEPNPELHPTNHGLRTTHYELPFR